MIELDDRLSVAKIGDIAAEAGIRRVHMLAWRDLDDVEAGGSELHAATVARLWAEAGIEVTMRTSYAQGHLAVDHRDGYKLVRRAGRYLVFPRAAAAEIAHRLGPRDALVEIWNGMPFFSPVWCHGTHIVFLHHVHGDMWRAALGQDAPLLASLGDTLERRVAPMAYRRSRIVTLSPSSKADIVERLRLEPEQISVVPPGVDPRFRPGGTRSVRPLVVTVGRLVPNKRVDRVIRAVACARAAVPDLELAIVGDGYERRRLAALAEDLGIEDAVTFEGHIDDDALVELYQRAWLVASASGNEGWGMTLTEAGACATPAVATRIPGHVDAVADGDGALLVSVDAAPEELAAAIVGMVADPERRRAMEVGALAHASRFTWGATAAGIMRVIAAEAARRRRRG